MRAGSGRRPLYSSELWSRSLTPSQSEARLSQAELRIASTTAIRGHSWRGEHNTENPATRGHSWRGEARPTIQHEKRFQFADRQHSSGHKQLEQYNSTGGLKLTADQYNITGGLKLGDQLTSVRNSARKSNLKQTVNSRKT